eukprot:scaffold527_cov368-Prasinococcus_capsulatus_cf.AAC.53
MFLMRSCQRAFLNGEHNLANVPIDLHVLVTKSSTPQGQSTVNCCTELSLSELFLRILPKVLHETLLIVHAPGSQGRRYEGDTLGQ